MSKKSYNKNYKEITEQSNKVAVDDTLMATNDSVSNEEIINEKSEIENDIVDEIKEENISEEIDEVKDSSIDAIVEERSAPFILEDPDIDFTVESKNKPKEEKELDEVIADIKNIIEPAVKEIDKEIVMNKEEEVKEIQNELVNKQKKITFEKMFGYFWNGQNYNF